MLLARPKSINLMLLFSSSKRFSGFKSRWAYLWMWEYSIAEMTYWKMRRASSSSSYTLYKMGLLLTCWLFRSGSSRETGTAKLSVELNWTTNPWWTMRTLFRNLCRSSIWDSTSLFLKSRTAGRARARILEAMSSRTATSIECQISWCAYSLSRGPQWCSLISHPIFSDSFACTFLAIIPSFKKMVAKMHNFSN